MRMMWRLSNTILFSDSASFGMICCGRSWRVYRRIERLLVTAKYCKDYLRNDRTVVCLNLSEISVESSSSNILRSYKRVCHAVQSSKCVIPMRTNIGEAKYANCCVR
jgi:hypothetical protein